MRFFNLGDKGFEGRKQRFRLHTPLSVIPFSKPAFMGIGLHAQLDAAIDQHAGHLPSPVKMVHFTLRQFSVEAASTNYFFGVAYDIADPDETSQGKDNDQCQHQTKTQRDPLADGHTVPVHSLIHIEIFIEPSKKKQLTPIIEEALEVKK